MRIHRSRLTRDFLQVPNATARDDRLSHMARGILLELLSRPDGWDTTADDMWRESVARHGKASPGRRQFRAAFAELKACGYMGTEQAQLERGQLGTVLSVRDIPLPVTDVPACGTSVPPGPMPPTADATDVPACGTSAPPAEMDVFAGRTGVPHAGTSYRKRSVENGKTKTRVVADAVGTGAGGFARAGATSSAGGERGGEHGGFAASGKTAPSTTTRSPRPRTYATRPRQQVPGFAMVRAAVPAAVARPGTRLYPGLHRAITDLLTGNPGAGIPSRTAEQVIARLNRRWYGEHAEERCAPGYRGCERCTASGCQAPRRSPDNPEGCDRIKNRSAWLAAALLAQDCPDPACEDGQIIGAGACRACQERHEEHRAAAAAVQAAAASWKAQEEAKAKANAAVHAWINAEAAEGKRIRATLAASGAYGVMLDHRVHQHMTAWRDRNPSPASPPQKPQAPVQGTFLIAVPGSATCGAAAPHVPAQRPGKRTVVCTGCDQGHRTHAADDLCPACREGASA